jgi:hypothetical protein
VQNLGSPQERGERGGEGAGEDCGLGRSGGTRAKSPYPATKCTRLGDTYMTACASMIGAAHQWATLWLELHRPA